MHKRKRKKGTSYIKSFDLLALKNTTIIPKNIDYRCLQYVFTLAQHYKKLNFIPNE